MKYVLVFSLMFVVSCATPIPVNNFVLNTPQIFKTINTTYNAPPFKSLILSGNMITRSYYHPYITYDEHGKPMFHIGGVQ